MLANLRALFGVIVDIVLLRRGPEHLPVSWSLVAVAAAFSTLSGMLLETTVGTNPGVALLIAIIASLVSVVWFRILLSAANKRERLPQMLTALFLVSALFVALLVPLTPPLVPFLKDPDPAHPPPGGPLFLATALCVWALVLRVRIIRAAFECPWFVAIMLMVSEVFVGNLVGVILFGGAVKAA